ncbi:hypothetical protein DL769_011201 [Monosporascus sp. CRB-8-3]|nr:hypothetical protein DL769_011201 [Monosporascus sp. CRB-8-3]
MTIPLSEEELVAEFDRRWNRGIIFYEDNPKIQTQTVNGFQYEFTVTGAIGKKPFIKDNADEPPAPTSSVKKSPGYVPGSDIDVSGYEITYINDTHLLMFNKFCMYRPHLLLLTKDGHRRQYEQLDLQDFQATWKVLGGLNWKYFMFFNCGKDGGCSRLHKHMQISPYLKDRLIPWPETSSEPPNTPYEFVLRRFESELAPHEALVIYEQMMAEVRSLLGLNGTPSDYVPHNVALGQGWILVIPRRNAGVGGAYGNTLSMLGMVSVATKEELRCWLSQGPREVQSQLGIPRRVGNGAKAQSSNGHHILSHSRGCSISTQDGLESQRQEVVN